MLKMGKCNNICYRMLQLNTVRHKSDLVSLKYQVEFDKFHPSIFDNTSFLKLAPPAVLERIKNITELSKDNDIENCGKLLLYAYEMLTSGVASDSVKSQIMALACGANMVQTHFKIIEEIATHGLRKEGTTVWHLHDASLYRSFVYELLKIYLEEPPAEIVSLFDKAFLYSATGIFLEDVTRKNCAEFTPERYKNIVRCKTSYPLISFPITLAMKMARNDDVETLEIADDICTDIGYLSQMQTDYLACYAIEMDEAGIPVHNDDIKQGKCTWPAVTTLQHCTPPQKIVFKATYGNHHNPSHIERVKALYDEISIPYFYNEEKQKICEDIENKIKKLEKTGRLSILFEKVFDATKNYWIGN